MKIRKSEADLRAALRESIKEEAAERGKTVASGREGLAWLETLPEFFAKAPLRGSGLKLKRSKDKMRDPFARSRSPSKKKIR